MLGEPLAWTVHEVVPRSPWLSLPELVLERLALISQEREEAETAPLRGGGCGGGLTDLQW